MHTETRYINLLSVVCTGPLHAKICVKIKCPKMSIIDVYSINLDLIPHNILVLNLIFSGSINPV